MESVSAGVVGPTADQMHSLAPILPHIFDTKPPVFPIDLSKFEGPAVQLKLVEEEEALVDGEESPETSARLPPPFMKPGNQYLQLRIHSIALKDADTYIEPYITFSVRGKQLL